MVESTWTGVCVFVASLTLRFHWKSHLEKQISLEAQGLFGSLGNPAVADK